MALLNIVRVIMAQQLMSIKQEWLILLKQVGYNCKACVKRERW